MLYLLTSLVYLQEEMSSSIQNVTTCWDDVTKACNGNVSSSSDAGVWSNKP